MCWVEVGPSRLGARLGQTPSFFLLQERDEVEGKIEGERKGFDGCGREESYKGI